MQQQPVVLITGSEGLIGDRVVKVLAGSYDEVGFDIERPNKNPEILDFTPCDLTKDDSVRHALETLRSRHGNRIASVIHRAAYYDFSGEPSPLYHELTIEGTRRLLRGLRDFEVDQFVFASTLLVMKPAETDNARLTEKSPTDPVWAYPQSKLATEQVIDEERGSMKAVILRVSGVYDEDCNSLPVAQQISRIYEKDFTSYFFPGDAGHGQPFVHLSDLTDCIRRCIERRADLDACEMFLIAEPEVVSYGELQDFIGEYLHGKEWPTIRIPKLVAKAGAWAQSKILGDDEAFIKPWMVDIADDHYPIEIKKARIKLGWEPIHRLRDTLDVMLYRLKQDPRKWYERNNLKYPGNAEQAERQEAQRGR
jgi:nucleoside-diphosphate-sugar epimerase